jgi:hypothetical protein
MRLFWGRDGGIKLRTLHWEPCHLIPGNVAELSCQNLKDVQSNSWATAHGIYYYGDLKKLKTHFLSSRNFSLVSRTKYT